MPTSGHIYIYIYIRSPFRLLGTGWWLLVAAGGQLLAGWLWLAGQLAGQG